MPNFYLLVPFTATNRDNAEVVRGRVGVSLTHFLDRADQQLALGKQRVDVLLLETVESDVKLAHLPTPISQKNKPNA